MRVFKPLLSLLFHYLKCIFSFSQPTCVLHDFFMPYELTQGYSKIFLILNLNKLYHEIDKSSGSTTEAEKKLNLGLLFFPSVLMQVW